MLKKLKCLWTVKELREKLLFTVMILLMFCAGSRLPAPFVAPGALGVLFSGADFLSYLNMMSGSSLAQCTVFSLGVAPAINASIIMQLLCVAIPKWERYAKDDDGKKRIERYTQLCTLILAVVMAVGYYFIARNYGAVKYTAGFAGVLCGVIVVSVFAAGAMTVQWLGTLIDARGIGSGLSMLIFAGIVSRWSGTVSVIRQIAERVAAGQWGYMAVGVFLLAFMLSDSSGGLPFYIHKKFKTEAIMSRKKIFGALFVVAVLVLAVLSSTVRSKVSLADERKYEELPQQENIYLSANKEQPQDAIEYQPMDSIELSSELELSPLGLPSDFSQEEIEIYKTVLQDFYDMQETIQFTCNITQTERIAEVLRRAYTSVECFWVSKLQWMHTETENGTVECSVIPQYSMSREERDHALLIINKHVNYIIQKSDGTPESIMHEAAEWLFAHAEYDHDEQTQLLKSRANLVGAFIDGKAVCAGYSRAAAYCLLRAGYSAAYCVGEAGGVCHAWNAYVDSTGRLVFADVTYAVTANDDLMVESFLDMEAETVSTRITDSEDWYFAG